MVKTTPQRGAEETLSMDSSIAEVMPGTCVLKRESAGKGLSFWLTSSQTQVEEGLSTTVYGIGVCCTLFGPKEETYIRDITSQRAIADELFELLIRNLVLPSTFKDVVEDFVQVYAG